MNDKLPANTISGTREYTELERMQKRAAIIDGGTPIERVANQYEEAAAQYRALQQDNMALIDELQATKAERDVFESSNKSLMAENLRLTEKLERQSLQFGKVQAGLKTAGSTILQLIADARGAVDDNPEAVQEYAPKGLGGH